MPEYIEKGKAQELIVEAAQENGGGPMDMFYAGYYAGVLAKIPAAEVEPVTYAHIVPRGHGKDQYFECLACNTMISPQWKRCPVCEAKLIRL